MKLLLKKTRNDTSVSNPAPKNLLQTKISPPPKKKHIPSLTPPKNRFNKKHPQPPQTKIPRSPRNGGGASPLPQRDCCDPVEASGTSALAEQLRVAKGLGARKRPGGEGAVFFPFFFFGIYVRTVVYNYIFFFEICLESYISYRFILHVHVVYI